MAVVIKDMVTNTRDLLGMPNHQDLPLYRVLLRMQRVIDHYRNRMNITDVDWILNTWRLAVEPSSDTFVVSAPSFGRPVLITSVSDAADSDSSFVKHTYPLCDVPDAHLFYVGPTQAATAPMPAPHVASAFSLYASGGQQFIKVTPRHATQAFYDIWYEPGRPDPPMLADNFPLLENFVNLVEAHTALDCYPAAAKGMDEVTRVEIKERLEKVFPDLRDTFESYIRQDVKEQVGPRRGWSSGQDWMDYWY